MDSRWWIAAGMAVLATPCPAQADRAGTTDIEIRVVGADGGPVPFAEIALEPDGQSAGSITDEGGVARITLPRGAQPVLQVSAAGKVTRAIGFADLVAAGFKVVLESEPTSGPDLVVQARRISSAYTPQAIGKLEILTDPLARADALLAVANLPGSTNADSSADIQLRGSAAAVSRSYFNDVPLYEVVRGSSVDRATRGFSVFNASIIQDVEVYPANPPLYLANTSGGAVRILPDATAPGASTVYASLAGAGISSTLPLGGDGRGNQTQLYATVTELAPLLALNPKLKAVTTSFHAIALGASTSLHIGDDIDMRLLTVVDRERGAYPFIYFGRTTTNESDRLRSYTIGTVEYDPGGVRLKLDAAYTNVNGDQGFGSARTHTRNIYGYLAGDAAGTVSGVRADYRVGLAREWIILRSDGDGLAGTGAPTDLRDRRRDSAAYTAGYGYLSVRPTPRLTLAVATRQYIDSRPAQPGSYQLTAALKSSDGRQHLIAGIGRYSSIVVPESPTIGRIASATSEQVSLDYKVERKRFRGSIGVYAKSDRIGDRRLTIHGLDASASVDLGEAVSAWASFTTARPIERRLGAEYRADNYLAYLVRGGIRVAASKTTAVSAALVARSGTPYTAVVGRADIAGVSVPVFDSAINARQLGPYRTVDVNVTHIATWWPGSAKPVAFLSLTNAADRRNPSRIDYDPLTLAPRPVDYQRRAVTIGLVFQL